MNFTISPQVSVCTGGVAGGEGIYVANCLTSGYQNDASNGVLTGQNPDTYLEPDTGQTMEASGGVAPIDIHSHFVHRTRRARSFNCNNAISKKHKEME